MDFYNNCLILWVIHDIWRGTAFEYNATSTLNIIIIFNFGEFTTLHLQWGWHCSISCLAILPNYQYACLFLLQEIVSIFSCCCSLKKGYNEKKLTLSERNLTCLIFLTTKKFVANFIYSFDKWQFVYYSLIISPKEQHMKLKELVWFFFSQNSVT
jgi:hypothetical protein